jgi:segregation and condensation protein B
LSESDEGSAVGVSEAEVAAEEPGAPAEETVGTIDTEPAGEEPAVPTDEPAAAADAPVAAAATEATQQRAAASQRPLPGTRTPRSEMEAALEAILFVSPDPQPRERLLELFEREDRDEAEAALAAVLERYRGDEGHGLMVEEVAGGVRLVSRPELHPYLRRFFQVSGRGRLSMAALETLAIIAYRQPLTGPEVADLRGVQSNAVIKTLLERRLVRIAGRKQVVGKPFLYATTREFLLHFGLGTLSDLPPLEEMDELFGADTVVGAAVPDREEQVLRESAALAEREADREEEGEGG